MRQLPWQRDELILALNVYIRHDGIHIPKSHKAISELSKLLNQRADFLNIPHDNSFRSIDSVYLKLQNFKRLDPTYDGKGLQAGNKMEEEIWNQFANDHEYLKNISQSIISTINKQINDNMIKESSDEEEEFPEGNVLYRIHKYRERNSKITLKAKSNAILQGKFYCEICGFSFPVTYGELGIGYIECHHTLPLSEYKDSISTSIKDIALVCSNCHRMLHRRRPWLKISDLTTILR
ncbi:MAG TPA: HNH endonuclease [Candidatus Cloacimonadota bacterium]|nr:HNH endonuclease [Candidatus Cloacimonadota bacterium]